MKSRSRRMILLPVQPFYAMNNACGAHGPYCHCNAGSTIMLRSPPGIPEGTKVTIVGTINGVVLLLIHRSQGHNMMLYNPFTGAFKILSDPPLENHYSGSYVYGFGYDTLTPHDVKIVRLRAYMDDTNSRSRPCDILSLKNGSWSTPLKLSGDYVFFEYSGVFVNGFLFWIASDSEHRVLVVALDLKGMVFSEIQLPPNRLFSRFPLGKINGNLCMICYERNSVGYYEVWALNEEDGGTKSWSFVNLSTSILRGRHHNDVSLMCFLDEGKLIQLRRNNRRLVIYNLLNDTQKIYLYSVDLTSLAQVRSPLAVEYVESLMSPSDLCSGFV
nr:uncharacterized protein LOC122589154 isoform X2 [Erigeron canadensis]